MVDIWFRVDARPILNRCARHPPTDLPGCRHVARSDEKTGEAWNNGKEKSPAALCRKVAQAPNGGSIEIWGDGKQTRSFLYVDECLDGTTKLLRSEFNDKNEPIYESKQVITNITVGKSMEDVTYDSNGKAENIYGYIYCG